MFHVAFFIIGSLLLAQVQAWRHASKSELDEALRIREHTLVACESWAACLRLLDEIIHLLMDNTVIP